MKPTDLTGRRFGRLLVIERDLSKAWSRVHWICQCDCGTLHVAGRANLENGDVQSCGCLRRDRSGEVHRTHGKGGTRVYKIYHGILQRCLSTVNPAYDRYGGRGIVCEWQSFEEFYRDMGEPPSPKHSIDRYPDNNGPYSKANCRWATRLEQANNTRSNHLLTYKGETRTVSEWTRHLNIPDSVLKNRVRRRWLDEKIFTASIRAFKGRPLSYPGDFEDGPTAKEGLDQVDNQDDK